MARSSRRVSDLNELQHVFDRGYCAFREADDLDLLFPVFEDAELGFVGEQVKDLRGRENVLEGKNQKNVPICNVYLSTVNLEKAAGN